MVATAIDDDKRAEFAGLFINCDLRLCRRKKNGTDKQDETDDWEHIIISRNEGHKDKSGSGNTEKDAEEYPQARVVAEMNYFGDEQNQGEEGAEEDVAKP
jgi:hypothetical protein